MHQQSNRLGCRVRWKLHLQCIKNSLTWNTNQASTGIYAAEQIVGDTRGSSTLALEKTNTTKVKRHAYRHTHKRRDGSGKPLNPGTPGCDMLTAHQIGEFRCLPELPCYLTNTYARRTRWYGVLFHQLPRLCSRKPAVKPHPKQNGCKLAILFFFLPPSHVPSNTLWRADEHLPAYIGPPAAGASRGATAEQRNRILNAWNTLSHVINLAIRWIVTF